MQHLPVETGHAPSPESSETRLAASGRRGKPRLYLAAFLIALTAAAQNPRAPGKQPPKTSDPTEAAIPANLPPAERAARKFNWIAVNGERQRPNMTSTRLTEQELNAYMASGAVKLPKGVHQVTFAGDNGQITGTANVNFDEIKEGRSSANPFLMIFSGTHEVKAVANGQGAGGRGTVHIQSVEIDGMVVPRLALEFFVDKYLKPKYPNVGLDSTFTLPSRIDTAVVGRRILTIVQK